MLARFEGADDVVQTRQIGHFCEVSLNSGGILDDLPIRLETPCRVS